MGVSSAGLEKWYRQLHQTLSVGVDLPSALEQCAGPPKRDRFAMATSLKQGSGVDSVLENSPRWLPQADRLLLSGAAASGKLAETCGALAEEHAELAANRRALWMAALYPLFILQGSLFLLPVAWSLEITEAGSPRLDTARCGQIFGLLMLAVWGTLIAAKILARVTPRNTERLARLLPGVGAYWKHRTLARFASTFDALLEAGVRYTEALGGAALAVNDTRLTPALLARLPQVEAGQPFGALVDSIRGVPASFAQLFQTGEQTGQLHRTLPQLAEIHRQAAKRALFHVAFWYPKLLFLLAAAMVGLSVASLYGEYLDFVLQMAE